VTCIRRKALSAVLVASILSLTSAPLLAAPSHEICDAMHHGCAKVDAVVSCCCGDRSEATPPRVPSLRADAADDSIHSVAAAAVTFDIPLFTVTFSREGPSTVVRPPDLSILFGDLRL